MSLLSVLERDVLRGALAFMPWDPIKELPVDGECRVSVMAPNGRVVQDAVPHTSGLQGFLRLRSGSYRALIRPTNSGFLPSLRSVTIPMPKGSSVIVAAPLRPSASYPVPSGAIALRATVHWKRPQVTPARWAGIFVRLEAKKNDIWRLVYSMWTRTDGNGEFAAILRPGPPGTEGSRDPLRAVVEIRARPPAAGPYAEGDLSDLILDDGNDENVRERQPLARAPITVETGVEPGAMLSLNQDDYTTQPDGVTPPMRHRVILLS